MKNIIIFLCSNHQGSISKRRLTLLLFLADWFSTLILNKTMTGEIWRFGHYGPEIGNPNVFNDTLNQNFITITIEKTLYDSEKRIFSCETPINTEIGNQEKKILHQIIGKTKEMYFKDLVNYVYSTYPISASTRCSKLDFVSLAVEFNKLQKSRVKISK